MKANTYTHTHTDTNMAKHSHYLQHTLIQTLQNMHTTQSQVYNEKQTKVCTDNIMQMLGMKNVVWNTLDSLLYLLITIFINSKKIFSTEPFKPKLV